MEIKIADLKDLNELNNIEKITFDESRQMSISSLKNSIISKHQAVFLGTIDSVVVGYAILFLYKNSYRLYSVAIKPEFQHQGLGKKFMHYIIKYTKKNNIGKLTLEVDATNLSLIKFYEHFGCKIIKELSNYYGENQPAYRMWLEINPDSLTRTKPSLNVVVTDIEIPWLDNIPNLIIINPETYITDEKYQKMKGLRIFNLCSSYDYQSLGYYVSLLASARLQRVIPNVATIRDFSDQLIIESIGDEALNQIQSALKDIKSNTISIVSYFGYTPIKKYQRLIKSLYQLFESPFIIFTFSKGLFWKIENVKVVPISDVETDDFIQEAAIHYFNQKHYNITKFKDYKYDLAILVDPLEKYPPSNKVALSKFKIAADKMGFYTEFITKEDYHRIAEFDALFIRATTNVNDYTYQFSRYAYAEGLIVIDDPWSILKCSNKLYLAESMKKLDINIPKTYFVSKNTNLDELISNLNFPIILKQPDSAFSMGVFKVNNKEELTCKLNELFISSELIVAQAFIQSAYDWRVGVLDNKPIFVCRYHMAKNHWQVINWQSKSKRNLMGDADSLRVEDAPKHVLSTALKACKAMGDGFYGVDLKELDGKVYVIEVNDNPNVDFLVEDVILKDELYRRIIKVIYDSIEYARNIKRKIA